MRVTDEDQTVEYRKNLLKTIDQKRKLLGMRVRNALLTIPRHRFIDHYYAQKGNTFDWHLITSPARTALPGEWPLWYNQIYADEPLVTQIDRRGHPTSSSSQPSVMAQMIEALSVWPGHIVLEVGSGTGYNAALLAHIVGENGAVISLDIDKDLAEAARERVNAVKSADMAQIQIINTNALTWKSPVLFDRIIVTGSHNLVPTSWLKLLKHDGILVMEWRTDWTGSLLQIQKHALSYEAIPVPNWRSAFMPLRESEEPQATSWRREGTTVVEKYEHFTFNFDDLEQNAGLLFWLQYHMPRVRKRRQTAKNTGLDTIYLLDELRNTTAVITQNASRTAWHVTVYGEYPLFKEFSAHCTQWAEVGQPTVEHYKLLFEEQSMRLTIF